jgi:hypothetical protein
MFGVDRHGRAAAPDGADHLAAVCGAFPHRRRTGIGHFTEVVAVAIGAAGADRQRAGGVAAPRAAIRKKAAARARAAVRKSPIIKSLPREDTNASPEGLPVGERRPSFRGADKVREPGMTNRSIDDRRSQSFAVAGGAEPIERRFKADRVGTDDQPRHPAPAQTRDMNAAIRSAHVVGA